VAAIVLIVFALGMLIVVPRYRQQVAIREIEKAGSIIVSVL